MNNDYIIAYLNNHVIIPKKGEIPDTSEETSKLRLALQHDLGVCRSELIKHLDLDLMTKDDIIKTYRSIQPVFMEKSCHPGFPEHLTQIHEIVENHDTDRFTSHMISYILDTKRRSVIYLTGITRDDLFRKVLEKPRKVIFELEWLVEKLPFDTPDKFLYQTLAKFGKPREGRPWILGNIGRSERKSVLTHLESIVPGYEIPEYDKIMWIRLGEKIHPGEWKEEFPECFKFFTDIRKKNIGTSKELEVKPSLLDKLKAISPEEFETQFIRLMERSWKSGLESEFFDTIQEKDLGAIQILRILKKIETRPGVGKYKTFSDGYGNRKTYGKRPEESEKEILDIIKTALFRKFLSKLERKEGSWSYIPESLVRIPVTSLIEPEWNKKIEFLFQHDFRIKLSGDIIDTRLEVGLLYKNGKSVRLDNYFTGIEQNRSDNSCLTKIEKLKDYKVEYVIYMVSTGYRCLHSKPLSGKYRYLEVLGTEGKPLIRRELKQNASSIIGFIYNVNQSTLLWVGESTKPFYAGHPTKVSDYKEVVDTYMEPPKYNFFRVYEKLYGEPVSEGEIVTEENFKKEIGL